MEQARRQGGGAKARPLRIALVGGGPRGLAAAEALMGETDVEVCVFEPGTAGAGPNFDPGQPAFDLLNIPVRAVTLPPPPVAVSDRLASFAAYAHGFGPDDYPPRAVLGGYLAARMDALAVADRPGWRLRRVGEAATGAHRVPDGWVVTAGHAHGPFDHLLIVAGHLPVDEEELTRWQAHAKDRRGEFADAYPTDALIARARGWAGRTVAMRGLGLSMIDAMRAVTEGQGGVFTRDPASRRLVYRHGAGGPARIVPFSLDGLPLAAKPTDAEEDARYAPDAEDVAAFQAALVEGFGRPPAFVLEPVFAVLADLIAARTPGPAAETRRAARAWLARESAGDRPLPQSAAETRALMAGYLEMARGRRAPSVGYGLGQIWRHLQPALRQAFNPRTKPLETAERVIGFDETMKRYAYGPPAEAVERLLALIDSGLLDLGWATDPEIALVDEGWRLQRGADAITAGVMIDTVLPAPAIAHVRSPLIHSLLEAGHLVPIAQGLGAMTTALGGALGRGGEPVPGLWLLGRLATGRVIATDSINDCFGPEIRRWAQSVRGLPGAALL